jgi:hypothetical protein
MTAAAGPSSTRRTRTHASGRRRTPRPAASARVGPLLAFVAVALVSLAGCGHKNDPWVDYWTTSMSSFPDNTVLIERADDGTYAVRPCNDEGQPGKATMRGKAEGERLVLTLGSGPGSATCELDDSGDRVTMQIKGWSAAAPDAVTTITFDRGREARAAPTVSSPASGTP